MKYLYREDILREISKFLQSESISAQNAIVINDACSVLLGYKECCAAVDLLIPIYLYEEITDEVGSPIKLHLSGRPLCEYDTDLVAGVRVLR